MNIVSLNIRQAKLLEELIKAGAPISLKNAAKRSGISACEKTLRSDFSKISAFSEDYGVTMSINGGLVSVSSVKGIDGLLTAADGLYKKSQIAYTQQRPMYIVLDCLLEGKIPTLDEWSEKFNISRPCIQGDVKKAKKWLADSDVSLESRPGRGYMLKSSELAFRKAIVRWSIAFFGTDIPNMFLNKSDNSHKATLWMELFGDMDFRYLCGLVNNVGKLLGVSFRERQYNQTVLYMAAAIRRVMIRKDITEAETGPFPKDTGLRAQARELLHDRLYTHFHILLSRVELEVLLGETAGRPSRAQEWLGQNSADTAARFAHSIAYSAEQLLGIRFGDDQSFIDSLTGQIIDILQNPDSLFGLNESEASWFKIKYPAEAALGCQVLMLAKTHLNKELPDESGILVGMFIAAYLEKLTYGRKRKKRVMLVSAYSISASMLTYWQIMNEFSDRIDIAKIASYQEVLVNPIPEDIDLIISSLSLNNLGRRNIVISPIITEEDMERIRGYLNEDTVAVKYALSKAQGQLKILPFYDDGSRTSRELIERIGSYMQDNAFALPGYTQALIEHEEEFGSGIESVVPMALPHTAAKYTRNEVLAVTVTRYPTSFNLMGKEGSIETYIVLFPLLQKANADEGFLFYSIISKLREKRVAAALQQCDSQEAIRAFLDTLSE